MREGITGRIGLKNLIISVKKGLYDSERLVENRFSISVYVDYNHKALQTGEFLNYERLAEIVVYEMESEVQLLESIAESILKKLMNEWPSAVSATVKIEKCKPHFMNVDAEAVLVELSLVRQKD